MSWKTARGRLLGESEGPSERGKLMSSKILGVVLGVSAFAAVGCQGQWVTLDQYQRDVAQLREYNEALERDNVSLRAKAEAYDQLKSDSALYSAANKTYAELADSLKRAL